MRRRRDPGVLRRRSSSGTKSTAEPFVPHLFRGVVVALLFAALAILGAALDVALSRTHRA
jgi:hypothetical protein